MSHGSHGFARLAVRQNSNAGIGFRETLGLHGKLKNFFIQLFQGGRMDSRPTRKSFLKKSVHPCDFQQFYAPQAFPPNAMPCAGVRHRATSPQWPLVRRSAVGITTLRATQNRPTGGHLGQPWLAVRPGPPVPTRGTG
jgi:hypothetical protein